MKIFSKTFLGIIALVLYMLAILTMTYIENAIVLDMYGVLTIAVMIWKRPKTQVFKGVWYSIVASVIIMVTMVTLDIIGVFSHANFAYTFTIYLIISTTILVTGLFHFIVLSLKRWHKFQIIFDGIVIGVMVTSLGIEVFNKWWHLMSGDFYRLLTFSTQLIMTLVLLGMLMFLMFVVDIKRLRLRQILLLVGEFGIGLVNLITVMSLYTNSPIDSILDYVYITILGGFFLASVLKKSPVYGDRIQISTVRKVKVLLVYSMIPFTLGLAGVVGYDQIWWALVIVASYYFINLYLEKSIENEIALAKETMINEHLEAIVEDRTKALEEVNDQLVLQSRTDSLTGLNNRRYFLECVQAFINVGERFYVLLLDLDRFKIVNDVYGHGIGDEVIKVVAERLIKNICRTCVVGRIGGDEFAIIIEERNAEKIDKVCQALEHVIGERIIIDQYEFYVEASIGISQFPIDGQEAIELIKYADIAMHHVKNSGYTHKHLLYASHQVATVNEKNKLELALRQADYDREFRLFYQPQYDAVTKRLLGFEALIRWFHPEYGLISPVDFIPLAEETGLIVPISEWVFHEAMAQCYSWNQDLEIPVTVAINLSPMLVNTIGFYENLQIMIRENNIQDGWLDFELTETSMVGSATTLEDILSGISQLGVNIAIDDFGTGYASMSYIKRFNVDILKIAKELIENIESNKDDLLIVKAIIMMADGLGIRTIGEGVETAGQYEILRDLGCDIIQGYYLGRPMPADEAGSLIGDGGEI